MPCIRLLGFGLIAGGGDTGKDLGGSAPTFSLVVVTIRGTEMGGPSVSVSVRVRLVAGRSGRQLFDTDVDRAARPREQEHSVAHFGVHVCSLCKEGRLVRFKLSREDYMES